MQSDSIPFFKSIGGKILLIFLVVVLASIGVVTALSIIQSSDALMQSQYAQLRAIRDIKKGQIQSYFDERRGDMNVLINTVLALRQAAFEDLEAVTENKKNAVEHYFERNVSVIDEETFEPDGEIHQSMNAVIGDRTGLGVSGETYIMEERDGKYFFRSDMRTMGDGRYVFGYDATDIAPEYAKLALQGIKGKNVFTDSAGNLVMVVYSPLDIEGLNWAIVTKMDLEEAIAPTIEGRNNDLYAEYIQEYGYYDLFLIHPNGRIFYTVTKEADYLTNIVNGEYSDSSLGEAVKKALSRQQFSYGDFRPYEPSNGEPAAFIAQPVVKEGKTELLVALQMPLERINAVMQERTGMGETGESYLVGPNKLMRSDSFLDPENHSVTASFANPELGKVDTEASRSALNGETDARIVIDYNGNPVLSAYTPVTVYDTGWALMSEIDEAEVRGPINALIRFILIAAAVMIAIAIIAALLFSGTISKPILYIVEGADRLSLGDIEMGGMDRNEMERINKRADEMGKIGRSFNRLIDYQKEKVNIAQEIAEKNLRVEASVSSDQDSLGKAFAEMVDSLNQILGQVNIAVDQVSTGSDQVSQASQNLSQGATEQASSLEEITSSINQINSQSQGNTKNAEEANALAKEASSSAVQGSEQMKELIKAMEGITASSEEINKIVKTIDDISFQINLLALNANVEAARAGKYGKGFAVVAEEVRTLANRSGESVRDTSLRVEEAHKNIRLGSELVEKTSTQLEKIVDGSNKVAEFLDEITQASREQTQGIEQINNGLEQIDQVTQSNTASAEESASSAEELASQAQQLKAMIAQFSLDEQRAEVAMIEGPGTQDPAQQIRTDQGLSGESNSEFGPDPGV